MNKDLPQRAEVVIIGGGIIGVSIAYQLARKGISDVLLLEKGMMGAGSTAKCAGGIRVHFSTEINVQFSLLSEQIWDRFEEEFGLPLDFHRVGYLFLAGRQESWRLLEADLGLMERFGQSLELIEPAAIKERWPFIRHDDLVGGAFSGNDGYAGPYEAVQGFVKGARRLGARLKEEVEVTGIEVERGRVKGVVTSAGERVETGVVVNAAGPFAGQVAALAGVKLPVLPYRRQLFFTDAFDELPDQFPLIIDMETSFYVRREGRGLLLAGPQDSQASFDETVAFEAQEWTAERAVKRVPILEKASIARGWAGLYEVSPDHHAIIGEEPEVKGLIEANGFSGHGFQHAPATGIVVAELIADGRASSIDIRPLRPARFREGETINEPLTAIRD